MHSIISIDGGGMLGIIPCTILNYIEKQIQNLGDDDSIRLADCVDFFAGTSTGGIISLALSAPDESGRPRYSVEQLLSFYIDSGPDIFDVNLWQKFTSGFGLRNSKYTDEALRKTMLHYFQEQKLSEALVPTLVTAYDLNAESPLYFKSYEAKYNKSLDYLTRDAALATASAPTYFPLAEIESLTGEKQLCVDGVMIAHNPSLIAYAAFRRLARGTNAQTMNLISLGTGYHPLNIDSEEAKKWGSMDWGSHFANIIVDGSSKNVNAQLSQVFADSPENYTRITAPLLPEAQAAMDCATSDNIEHLINSGKTYIENNKHQLDNIANRLYHNAFHPESKIFFKGLGVNVDPIWIKHYPQSVNPIIDVEQYSNLTEILDEASLKYGDQIAYKNFGVCITFNQVKRYAEQVAYWLQSQNLHRRDRIAIMMPNCLSYPIIFQAIIKAGMIAVNINPLYTSRELDHVIKDSGCKVLFTWEGAANVLEKCQYYQQITSVVITKLTDYFPPTKAAMVNAVNKHIKKIVPKYQLKSQICMPRIIASTKGKYPFGVPVTADDIAFIQYTGGTTGVSKGAMITHRNIVANVLQTIEVSDPEIINDPEPSATVTALPLYHIFGLTINSVYTYSQGMMNILISNPKDIDSIINDLKKQPISFMTGVNTLFNALLNHPKFSEIDWSQLKTTLAGGMVTRTSTAQQWLERTGNHISNGYGLTETSPGVTFSSYEDTEYTGSVGMPMPSTQVMVADTFGNPLPTGEIGEICVNGPQVMKGYWQQSRELPAQATVQQWFRTGDMGKFDERGHLYIVDRLKDMILTSGFNIFPNEIEEVIDSHPSVLESACIGIDNEGSGEIIKAFIVRKDDIQVDASAIISWCKEYLTAYKIPKIIEFTEQLPKSNVGKIIRRSLREL